MDDFIETTDEWEDTDLDDTVSSDKAETEADQTESLESPEEGQYGDEPAQDRGTDQFLLKHLGSERTVTREEIIPLAQKGLDYDRVRTKLTEQQKALDAAVSGKREGDAALATLGELRALARETGFGSVEEMIDETRASILAGREKIDLSLARSRVALERKERALKNREAEMEGPKQREKSDSGFEEFVEKFPEVKAEEIPVEVWRAVDEGKTLSQAWAEWKDRSELEALRAENRRLTEQVEAERKNAENRQKSTGSRSGLAASSKDEIDRIWNEDD